MVKCWDSESPWTQKGGCEKPCMSESFHFDPRMTLVPTTTPSLFFVSPHMNLVPRHVDKPKLLNQNLSNYKDNSFLFWVPSSMNHS